MDELSFVRKCIEGDAQSWDEFVSKYSRLVYAYIHRALQLRGVDHTYDTVNDLFQEIFQSLFKDNFKKLRSFKAKNGSSLATWLRQVVIRSVFDHIRDTRPCVSIDEENEEGLSLKELLVDEKVIKADARIDYQHVQEKLMECIAALDGDEKYFVELHFNQAVALEDLSVLLRVSRAAVDMRKSRIIERLRECFKSKGVTRHLL